MRANIGLDLRALPTGLSPAHIDIYVRGQASDLAAASAAPPPEIFTWPSTGVLEARFTGPTEGAALARCDAAVRAYLADAPRLPVIGEPAAQLTEPCAPCE